MTSRRVIPARRSEVRRVCADNRMLASDLRVLFVAVFVKAQIFFGDGNLIVLLPALWNTSECLERTIEIRSQDLVKHSVTVWAKRNTVYLSITSYFSLPFFFINNVNGIRQRKRRATHDARVMLVGLAISNNLAFDVRMKGHQWSLKETVDSRFPASQVQFDSSIAASAGRLLGSAGPTIP